MKKLILLTLLFTGLNNILFSQSEKERKTKYLNELTKNLDGMYEGEIIGSNDAFIANDQNIYTIVKVKISLVNYGNVSGTEILLARRGGSVGNREEFVYHANTITKFNTFFNHSNSKVTDVKTNKEYYVLSSIAYDEKFNIVADSERFPFKTFNDFYSSLSEKIAVKFEKKNVAELKKNEIDQIQSIPYEQSTKNYNDIINARIELKKKGLNKKASLIENLELQLVNPTITGSLTKYYEFDVLIRGNSSSTYLDNVPVHISYNSSAFGTNAVAANRVFVTNGSNFANINYTNFNVNKTDFSASVFAFAASADDITSPTPFRTNITTTFQNLAHVKIQLNPCGVTPVVTLTNAAIALNVSFYSTFPNDNFINTLNYDNLNYIGSSLSTFFSCNPTISDFNSPVRGGVDTLKIKGYNFGTIKGNVYFRNADLPGFPNNLPIDTNDYIKPWSDTLLTIKMPSFLRASFIATNKNNTPGTGAFRVVTAGSQTATSANNTSSQTFTVSWSLFATDNPSTGGRKRKLNLINSNGFGGYTWFCDTSVGKHPQRFKIVQRAIRDWACLTTSNINLIYDSTIVDSPTINFLKFRFFGPITPFAITNVSGGSCPSTLNKAILNFDTDVRSDENWFYDTTGLPLPANMADFYEIISHEIGHCLGQQHIIDVNSCMYFSGNFAAVPTPPANRRTIKIYSAEADGGLYQVSNSIAVITPADAVCAFADVTPYNQNCENYIGIKEIGGNQLKAKLFPNPSTDGRITVNYYLENSKESTIQINDMLGNIIYNKITNSGSDEITESIDLSNVHSGIYILTLRSDVYKSTFKLVKQ